MAKFDENTLYILDSYGLIYRCYFAFISRPLTNSRGENISAVFGFFRNLHSILNHYKPKCIVAAMDSKVPTFRHEKYPEYKATRPKTPEDLHTQIPFVEEILKALGIPVLQCDRYEADDVIATLTRKTVEQGKTCRILSGDKDLMQLVNENVQILKPDHADVWKVIGAEGVKAEWGVMPEKLLDLLSLCGDTADNVPGVKGVGVKTACKFLDEYGSLEGLYEHASEIKGAIGQKIRDGKDSAFMSKDLITLFDQVPCEELDSAVADISFDYAAAAERLRHYEANAVAKNYEALAKAAGQSAVTAMSPEDTLFASNPMEAGAQADTTPLEIKVNSGNYEAITDIQKLDIIIEEILQSESKTFAYDSETDGLDTTKAALVGFSICRENGKAFYIPVSAGEQDLFSVQGIRLNDALHSLEKLFNNPEVTVIMHNAKFDYQILRTAGIKLESGKLAKIVDTMIAAWLLDPDRMGKTPFSLESLAETKLGLKGIEFDDIVAKGQTFRDVPLEKAKDYASEDADFTFQLWTVLKEGLEKNGLTSLFNNIEMPVLTVLAEMELCGIHLDSESLAKYDKELEKNISVIEKEIYETVGHEFNIASTKQLQEVLFTERGLKPGKKTKTGYSTDTSVLEELAAYDPVPAKILEFREMAKLQSTYVEALPKLLDSNSRLHTTFIQTGTATGRLSSRDPNLQNIPVRNDAGRKIRQAFTATEGNVLISADYAQIELVILAHLSQDPVMCEAFRNGTDVHKATASLIYQVAPEAVTPEMRRTAKTINFGVIYGMSAFRLAGQLGISRTQAAQFIDSYFEQYASIKQFIDQTIKSAEEKGFVETIFSRKRSIMNINSRNKLEKAAAERIAVNTPIQGSAADIVKKAMIDVDKALKANPTGAKMLLQVHDELILECPDNPAAIEKTISIIEDSMENAVTLSVPLRVSVESGKNWGEFH